MLNFINKINNLKNEGVSVYGSDLKATKTYDEIDYPSKIALVVGSENSSNSNRLKELAEKSGSKSYLIDDPDQISGDMLENVSSLGITAGASAPEELVQSIVQKCTDFGYSNEEELDGLEENIYFKLPSELRWKRKLQ